MLQTIRAKLLFLLGVIFLGISSLGYLLVSNTIKAQSALEKVQAAGSIAKHNSELLVHARGHQITFNPKLIESYNKSYANLLKDIQELEPMLNNKENLELLAQMKKTIIELKPSSDERFTLVSKYTFSVNTSEFANMVFNWFSFS